MTVTSTEGTAEVVIDWQQSTWEITLGEGNIVTNVTPTSGGDNNGEHQFTKVTTDRNGTTTELTITQEGAGSIALTVDPAVKYQPVAGFGGMYAVSIWGTPTITADEMNKMYSPDGLR